MVNQQLLDYIKQQLQQGVSRDVITNNLISRGWRQSDIDEGFSSVDSAALSQISTTQQPERKFGKTLLAIISIVGVLIIGGGVFGYFYYFRETPEKVIEKMKTRLAAVKTFECQGEIKAKVATPALWSGGNLTQPARQAPGKQANDFSVNFNAKYDMGDLNNPKVLFAFIVKTDALKELTQGESAFGLEISTINKVVYVQLNNLSNNLGSLNLNLNV